MAVNIVTGSMLKGLRRASCRVTTIYKCKGYSSVVDNLIMLKFSFHLQSYCYFLMLQNLARGLVFLDIMCQYKLSYINIKAVI